MLEIAPYAKNFLIEVSYKDITLPYIKDKRPIKAKTGKKK